LTSRNQQTLPASIPQFRHSPPTERFLQTTTCTKLVRNDEAGIRRNADQIVRQTSGEYGKYLIEPDSSAIRLNMTASRPSQATFSLEKPLSINTNQTHSNPYNATSRIPKEPILLEQNPRGSIRTARSAYGNTSARQDTARSDASNSIIFKNTSNNDPFSNSNNNTNNMNSNNNLNNSSNLYLSTLSHLDGAFDRRSQRDLFAASLPPKAEQQLRWVAIGNHKCAQQSEGWAGSLRREKDRTVVGGGFAGLEAMT